MTNDKSAEEIVRGLRDSLPPKIDYAELVCAEGFAHGTCYVWDDPLPYQIEQAADMIESLQAQLEEWKSKHRQAALNYQQKCQDIVDLEAQLSASQQRERAAVEAINRMADYIVTRGRVDYWLCDDIPEELHIKHQPKNDGNYENAPCIKCVAEYFMRGPQTAKEETKQ